MGLIPVFQKIDQDRKEQTCLLLLIDQLEELFTHTALPRETVTQFIKTLDVLSATGRIRILATLRSDFYAGLLHYPELVSLAEGEGQYNLLPLRQAHIHRIITEPAWLSGIRFEENSETGEYLDQRILNDAIHDPDALPLLEYTLRELYENRTSEDLLTFQLYDALGGVEGALGKRAEEIWQDLPEPARNTVPKLFRFLTTINEDQEYTSRAMVMDDYQTASGEQHGDLSLALESFVQARLLISHKNETNQVVVRLAHEALMHRWKRLKHWLVDSRGFLQSRDRLEVSRKRWQEENAIEKSSKSAVDYLLPDGKPLADALELQTHWQEDLTCEQLNYIKESFAYREICRRKRLRFYQLASVMCLVLFLLALAGAGIARQQKEKAENEKNKALVAALHSRLASKNKGYQNDGRFLMKNGRIIEVDLSGARVEDISALENLPLKSLNLSDTLTWNLEPIHNMPIKKLDIRCAGVIDATPILSLKELEILSFSPVRYMKSKDKIEKLMHIKKISTDGRHWYDPSTFWKKNHANSFYSLRQQDCAKKYNLPITIDVQLPQEEIITFILIPPGKFNMGSPENELDRDEEEKLHEVEITKPYYLSVCEITQKQWTLVTGYNNSRFKYRKDAAFRPVEMVSYNEIINNFIPKVQKYLDQGELQLPMEAEWEYACRAGTQTRYYWGNDISPSKANYNCDTKKFLSYYRGQTSISGIYPPNRWGLHDMSGNVLEWCEEKWCEYFYAASSSRNPTNSVGDKILLRGGSWFSEPKFCRSANRHKGEAGSPTYSSRGFRLKIKFFH